MSNLQLADRSLTTIVKDLSADLGRLVRSEIELAKTELQQNITRLGTGAGLLGGAGVAGLFALEFLLLALMFGIAAAGLPFWLAALIVGVAMAIAGGLLALGGKKNVTGATVVPTQTIENVKTDIKAVKDDIKRMRSSR